MFENIPRRNRHRRNTNNHSVSVSLPVVNNIIQNVTITKDKKEELEAILKGEEDIFPYNDNKREFVTVLKNKIPKSKKFHQRESNKVNVDRTLLTLRKMAGFESLDDIVDYPFSFNYKNFHDKSGRIDVYSNISKIQRTNTYIDDMRGISGFTLNHSSDAFGENNTIKNSFTKSEKNVYNYEDNLIASILVNNEIKYVIDKIVFQYNNLTDVRSFTVVKRRVNKHTNEARYFAYEENVISPFKDVSFNSNDSFIQGSRFKLTSTDHNSIMLENRNIKYSFKEDILYHSAGKDYDFSLTNGKESMAFSERIN